MCVYEHESNWVVDHLKNVILRSKPLLLTETSPYFTSNDDLYIMSIISSNNSKTVKST